MAEIFNLRMARKAKARSESERQAAANRARHGLSKGEKQRAEQERERAARLLDGARREED